MASNMGAAGHKELEAIRAALVSQNSNQPSKGAPRGGLISSRLSQLSIALAASVPSQPPTQVRVLTNTASVNAAMTASVTPATASASAPITISSVQSQTPSVVISTVTPITTSPLATSPIPTISVADEVNESDDDDEQPQPKATAAAPAIVAVVTEAPKIEPPAPKIIVPDDDVPKETAAAVTIIVVKNEAPKTEPPAPAKVVPNEDVPKTTAAAPAVIVAPTVAPAEPPPWIIRDDDEPTMTIIGDGDEPTTASAEPLPWTIRDDVDVLPPRKQPTPPPSVPKVIATAATVIAPPVVNPPPSIFKPLISNPMEGQRKTAASKASSAKPATTQPAIPATSAAAKPPVAKTKATIPAATPATASAAAKPATAAAATKPPVAKAKVTIPAAKVNLTVAQLTKMAAAEAVTMEKTYGDALWEAFKKHYNFKEGDERIELRDNLDTSTFFKEHFVPTLSILDQLKTVKGKPKTVNGNIRYMFFAILHAEARKIFEMSSAYDDSTPRKLSSAELTVALDLEIIFRILGHYGLEVDGSNAAVSAGVQLRFFNPFNESLELEGNVYEAFDVRAKRHAVWNQVWKGPKIEVGINFHPYYRKDYKEDRGQFDRYKLFIGKDAPK